MAVATCMTVAPTLLPPAVRPKRTSGNLSGGYAQQRIGAVETAAAAIITESAETKSRSASSECNARYLLQIGTAERYRDMGHFISGRPIAVQLASALARLGRTGTI